MTAIFIWVLITMFTLAFFANAIVFALKILWYVFAGLVLSITALVVGIRFAIHKSQKAFILIKKKFQNQ